MFGNGMNKVLVIIGVGDKVSFAVDFYESSHFVCFVQIDINKTFSSNAAGFLSRLGQAFFSQVVDGFIHIAVGSGQGFFAVHHASAGAFTQFLDLTCSNCHVFFLLK
jgi:hypothetical protein